MKSKKKQMIVGLVGSAVGLLVVGGVVSGAVKKSRAQRQSEQKVAEHRAPKPVQVEVLVRSEQLQVRRFPGIIQASDETALSFRVSGPLKRMCATPGRSFRSGDVLMQLDPRDFEDRIGSLEAQVAGAQAKQTQAQRNYERIAKLFEETVVPQSDLDRALGARDAANAAVRSLNAALQIARHALEDTVLRAPYDGTVSAQFAEAHELVAAGHPVVQFQNIHDLEVAVRVSENEMVQRDILEAQSVSVSLPALPEVRFPAQLKEWSSKANPLTRTYDVTFGFEAPDEFRVLPGMSADVSWNVPAGSRAALTIPVSALSVRPDGETQVWVLAQSGGVAQPRRVTLGALVGTSRVEVAEGLAEGERVVVSGGRLIHATQPLQSMPNR